MLFLAFGIVTLVLSYQNYFFKRKRQENELLLKTALESEKQERQRIAADLHDGVSGDLNAMRNYLTVLHKMEVDNEKKQLFEEIKNGVEAALENTRQVSYKLMPPLLESSGIAIALQDYFENLSKKTSKSFNTLFDNHENCVISPSISYELFRIIQEFSTNMIKYGDITRCDISLYCKENMVFIEIIDDGKSFNFNTLLSNSKGTGIKNINSRLKVIEATLEQLETSIGNHFVIKLKKQ